MGIFVPETCWGNKTAYFVASGWFFTFTMSTMHDHMNIKLTNKLVTTGFLEYVHYSALQQTGSVSTT
jgi:hypothetical protein